MIAFTIAAGATALMLTAAAPTPNPAIWTTLGTNAGPIPSAKRFEPANLLQAAGQTVLVDAGDGASVQLAKAGFPLVGLQTLVLSHLHFDHTGGLFAVISERYQMLAPGVLTIYGPPGTQTMVSGLLEAMAPSPPSEPRPPSAAKSVKVIEINDGSTFMIGAIKVTAARNTHYVATPGGDNYVSLSYRFDTPTRSIVFTGDTGPSVAVEKFARGADLLVSEIIDPNAALEQLKAARPNLPPPVLVAAKKHFDEEHLSPEQVGLIAAHAGVKELVLTHDNIDPAQAPLMKPGITANYKGPIIFAQDLDRF